MIDDPANSPIREHAYLSTSYEAGGSQASVMNKQSKNHCGEGHLGWDIRTLVEKLI